MSGTMRDLLLTIVRRVRWLALVGAVALAGCKEDNATSQPAGDRETITPLLYWELPPRRQAEIRTKKIYIPEGVGYAEEMPTKGPWESKLERMVHQCETNYFVWQLSRTMFEFEHPTIMLEGMAFDM